MAPDLTARENRYRRSVAGVIASGRFKPGEIPRGMCQPPVMEPVRPIRQLTPGEQLNVLVTMTVGAPEVSGRALRCLSDDRAAGGAW